MLNRPDPLSGRVSTEIFQLFVYLIFKRNVDKHGNIHFVAIVCDFFVKICPKFRKNLEKLFEFFDTQKMRAAAASERQLTRKHRNVDSGERRKPSFNKNI
jgi:hypothetical protein